MSVRPGHLPRPGENFDAYLRREWSRVHAFIHADAPTEECRAFHLGVWYGIAGNCFETNRDSGVREFIGRLTRGREGGPHD